MKRTVVGAIRIIPLLACVALLSGCATPVPEYSDPLSGVSRSAANKDQPLSKIRLGLVHSENSRKAIEHLTGNFEFASSPLADSGDSAERDPARVTRGINTILSNRFGEVVPLPSPNSAAENGVDLIMILDLKIVDKMHSFSTTVVEIGGIFIDLNGNELTRVSGKGQNKVPYPAFSVVGKTLNDALAQFQQSIDSSTPLVELAGKFSGRKSTIATGKKQEPDRPNADFPTNAIAVDFKTGMSRPDDIAVIIGNADYGKQGKDIPDVVPAYADAEGFKRYALTALGIREGNIINLRDATGAQMERVFGSERTHKGQLFDWVRSGVSNVHVYYAGHGAPAGDDGTAYLVPSDAAATAIDINGYPLDVLYRNLGKLPVKSVTVVLEACFSGASQGGTVIPKASGIHVRPKVASIPENITVIAAGSPEQLASWEQDGSHGLFTKYYLTGMSGQADQSPHGNGDGRVSYGELESYLKRTMTYFARRYYGRDQTAVIVAGGGK